MCTVKIHNLPKEIPVDELQVLFSQFGEIRFLTIKWDAKKKDNCGATIEYDTKEAAGKAKQEYDGADLDKNIISIEIY